jgi:putative transposase
LEKEFNAAKQANPALAFITEVSKFAAQGACRNYRNARSRWLNKELQARRPVFHKKNRAGAGSFLAASGVNRIRCDGHRRIRLPYLGSVRMTRKLPDGIPYEVSVKRQNGRWYASVAYWKTPALPPQRETQSVGGVDVGISPLAVDSGGAHPNPKAHYQPVQTANGQWRYPNPRGYAKALKALTRWQRAQARRTPGSRGWWEAQRRIDRAHRRAKGLRDNAHHHVSRALVRKYHTLGIETLNVSGMIRAGLQSKALADAGMSGLLDKIRYKAERCGTTVVEADQWYPSSKTCSVCGVVNGDLGREPEWDCPNCGAQHDRNENAARNLRKLALLAVGEDVMLPDGEALAGGDATAGETAPDEGRTKPETTVHPQLRLVL